MVGDDQILLDVHEAVHRDAAQLVEGVDQVLAALVEKLQTKPRQKKDPNAYDNEGDTQTSRGRKARDAE